MGTIALNVNAVGSKRIPPDPTGTAQALQRIGYDLEDALSDLIDNSIDANASKVLIRFFRTESAITKVVVVDDGNGMSETDLHHAMQYGMQVQHRQRDLGKYGIGLKTASFSQCQTLSVFSKQDGCVNGRRWTLASMQDNWRCIILDMKASAELFNHQWSDLDLSEHGTIVMWDDLDSLKSSTNLDKLIRKITRSVPLQLGLRFHKFLAAGKVKLFVDVSTFSATEVATIAIPPLNPFAYPKTGKKGYPINFDVDLPGRGQLKMQAHIWPAKSEKPEYKLGGGRVAERQGFYFYRNQRLIQGGGWNQVRESDSEPHCSLARVEIELPPRMDAVFSLTIQKSKVVPPTDFKTAVLSAKCGSTSFEDYIAASVETYRDGGIPDGEDVLVPGTGLPSGLQRRVAALMNTSNSAAREINFEWTDFNPEIFFVPDVSAGVIYLNLAYRPLMVAKGAHSTADIPIIKLLLFLLLAPDLKKSRSSKKRTEWHSLCNTVLINAIKATQ